MQRREFAKALAAAVPVAYLAVGAQARATTPSARPQVPGEPASVRTVVEYALPASTATHELIKLPNAPMLLVTQMDTSRLVKIGIDPRSEALTVGDAHQLGTAKSGLHGLAVSAAHPGMVWVTLEHDDEVVLVDPGADTLSKPPTIVRRFPIPPKIRGPHNIIEYGRDLWIGCKGSDHVLRISHHNPSDHTAYRTGTHPIFIARHPVTKHLYATIDLANQIQKIEPGSTRSSALNLRTDLGRLPVGMCEGPKGVWFSFAGTATGGAGRFAMIDEGGKVHRFRLASAVGQRLGLLHLAFARQPQGEALWLLATSLISDTATDALVRVTFDPTYRAIASEEVIALPTQASKTHRIVPLTHSVVCTELTTSTVSQVYLKSR